MTYLEYLNKILDLSKGQRIVIVKDIQDASNKILNTLNEKVLKEYRILLSEFHQVERMIDSVQEEICEIKEFRERRIKGC